MSDRPDLDFTSDNVAGASPQVMQAVLAANAGKAAAYGADEITARVTRRFADLFGREVAVAFAPTGTAANALAAALFVRPWQSMLAFEESHLADDECGAPEFFTHGAKIVGIRAVAGSLRQPLSQPSSPPCRRGDEADAAGALSLSNVTECGLVYRPARGVCAEARGRPARAGVAHGWRAFPNAVAALGCPPADITWKAGWMCSASAAARSARSPPRRSSCSSRKRRAS